MRRVELFTSNREYVATVEIILFSEGHEPEIILWGERIFKKMDTSADRYVEVFTSFSETPSPGLERAGRCKESTPEGEYTRPCELFDGHLGRHLYEVVTAKNANRLRTPIPPAPPVDRTAITTLRGTPIDKLREDQQKQPTGMHADYIVLSDEERAKGFVRPVRNTYIHVGIPGPKYPLSDLTKEQKTGPNVGYVKFEKYPEEHSLHGRYWTQKQLESIGGGCGGATTMGDALSETYARDPNFYGSTFCCRCNKHLPVGEFGEFIWSGTDERVGT